MTYLAGIWGGAAISIRGVLGSGRLGAGLDVVVDVAVEKAADALLAVVDEELAAARVDDVAIHLAVDLVEVLDLLNEALQLDGAFVKSEVLRKTSCAIEV